VDVGHGGMKVTDMTEVKVIKAQEILPDLEVLRAEVLGVAVMAAEVSEEDIKQDKNEAA